MIILYKEIFIENNKINVFQTADSNSGWQGGQKLSHCSSHQAGPTLDRTAFLCKALSHTPQSIWDKGDILVHHQDMGGNQNHLRKPTQTWGDHVNFTQFPAWDSSSYRKLFLIFFSTHVIMKWHGTKGHFVWSMRVHLSYSVSFEQQP